MLIEASCKIELETQFLVPAVFMLRPRSGVSQFVLKEEYIVEPLVPITEYTDTYGNLCQRLIIPPGVFHLESRVTADCADQIDIHMNADWVPVSAVPDEVMQFLLQSRYCEADKLGAMAADITRGYTLGYAQVEAIRQWIHQNIRYEYGVTNASTSALDITKNHVGVCRDFAHLGIALCRSLNIPARMVVGYLHELEPMDLHAWFEAYVGDRWYTFDATQSQPKGNRIAVAYGRDAADVAFASYFGAVTFRSLTVEVQAVQPSSLSH